MDENDEHATLTRFAYGFYVAGVRSRFLERAAEGAGRPLLTVRRFTSPDDGSHQATAGTRTVGLTGGGRLVLDRPTLTAAFETPKPLSDDDVAHPYLAPAAAVMATWMGWDAFHAGAFAAGGRALAILGARTHGKSTLLAELALQGVAIVTDDVLVVEHGRAQAGPRCIDLRLPDARSTFPAAPLEPSRSGERGRLQLPVLAAEPVLAGWVALDWGERLELEELRPSQRLHRLARAHSRAGGPRDAALLELARLPGWVLRRPPRVDLLGETARRVAGILAG